MENNSQISEADSTTGYNGPRRYDFDDIRVIRDPNLPPEQDESIASLVNFIVGHDPSVGLVTFHNAVTALMAAPGMRSFTFHTGYNQSGQRTLFFSWNVPTGENHDSGSSYMSYEEQADGGSDDRSSNGDSDGSDNENNELEQVDDVDDNVSVGSSHDSEIADSDEMERADDQVELDNSFSELSSDSDSD